MHGAVHNVRLSSTASRLEVQEVRCNSFFTIIMVIIISQLHLAELKLAVPGTAHNP